MADPHAHDADYHRGEMEIAEQESTWDLFMAFSKWGSLLIAATVLFFTMWLFPRGDFMAALVATVVLVAGGIFFLRKKPAAH
ncbi:aa3-type cytochrome c oxidase subunit IV [Brevundimonas sp. 2R-24]|uniref:Aa3-type cytochrome c oxidase subunit IV n=1 Tax=Peiella sedimenti TaxID=3061083 RepID=A0ABT8SLF4_9CAUL|nr:aa3-type cytochrome c oxidase subunit IV [Caulobacteraceae bacterium XZ-24]